eukprot:7927795-Pyramimonas_sp.AAC.1
MGLSLPQLKKLARMGVQEGSRRSILIENSRAAASRRSDAAAALARSFKAERSKASRRELPGLLAEARSARHGGGGV